jgi:autotransporter-associated beta strand protein
MLDIETSLSSFTIGELNGDSLSTVESIPSIIINTDSSTNGLFAGVIQNHLSTPLILTKQGLGTQTFSGINTYSGGTIVSSGFLNVQNSSGLGTGAVSVTSGAQLQVQNDISVSNSLTLNGVEIIEEPFLIFQEVMIIAEQLHLALIQLLDRLTAL